jgi:fumarate reductase subunit C
MLRELSCLFIAWLVIELLLLINAINAGEDRYRQLLRSSTYPWLLLLNIVALLFVLLHTATWFNQAPRAIVVRMHGRRVSRGAIVSCLYLLWIVLSALTVWIGLQ